MMKTAVFGAAAFVAIVACGAVPVSVTNGKSCPVPSFEGMPYVQEGEVAAIRVPNAGWKIDWQRECPRGSNDVTGLTVDPTEVELRGEKVPAIRITCTPGKFSKWPLVALPFEIDFSKWNVLSFSAKVEHPEGVKPLMLDSTPMIGWYSGAFFERWDDFGVSADDGLTYPWAGHGVHTTDFKNHDYTATRTKDGFTEFRWDVPHEERTGYKGFVEDRVRSLYFMYDTRKIKEGQKVVITIADMKLVKGWHRKFVEPERWAAWQKRVAEYEPDFTDSSYHLEPPKEGRVGFLDRVRLAKGGVAQAEIVVDLSDDILLDNWFKGGKAKMLEIRQSRGYEKVQARAAAYALQKWLKELTGGAEFPVVTQPTDGKKAKIFLGAGFAKDLFADDLKALADGEGGVDGFAVRVKDGNVYIFGAHPTGTSNGVFAFLENNTDVIWAMAGDPDGTIFTPDPDLTVVWGDALEKPAFIIRGWQGGDYEWMRQNRSNFYSWDREYGFSLNGGHYLSPQYYQSSEGIQDYNAKIGGKRTKPWSEGRMLCCLADPAFPKHAWETVPRLQELRYGGNFACVFGTDDNCGVCECEKCTAPIKTLDGRMLTPDIDYQAYYGAWFYTYLNKLDNEIQKLFPGFMTSTYAYFFAASYPPIKLNKTIVPWLCTYYRKAYNQPIYAPANQNWWKIYNDWMKHSKDIYLYDYYGLGMNDAPIAEVYQEDLKAQRSIGFLRTSTEGFGKNQYCGCGDERWTMARLAWNPDADVEQLHRRFNRRTYREAAPWIDRFRGVIRDNWYRNFRTTQHLNENLETFCMIRQLGLDEELRGYLAEAQKAVRNSKSKKLLEKLVADYDAAMTRMDWYDPFPSAQKNPPKIQFKAQPVYTSADVNFTNLLAEAKAFSAAGNWPAAREKLLQAASDGLVEPESRQKALASTLGILVRDTLKIDAKGAMDLWREISGDEFKRANGWSLEMGGVYWLATPDVVNFLPDAFLRRRQPEEAAKVFDIWANWDGRFLPSGLRAVRIMKKIDFLRMRKVDVTLYLGGYLAALRDCAKNGCTSEERGEAKIRLWREEMGKKSVDARLAGLFEIIGDRFMVHTLRQKATQAIPDACTVDGRTDWARVVSETLKAIDAGDWSGLWRNTYSRQNRKDLRLDVLIEIVEKMAKAGEVDAAADLLKKGAKALGYVEGATKESLDLGGPDGFEDRVRKLKSAMDRFAREPYDLVIYGSTPAALTAAIEAQTLGKTAVIVSPETRIGGLTTGGLGATDIGNKSAFGGLALKFYRDVAAHYGGAKDVESMWTFEPHMALDILMRWEKECRLDIRRGELLDRSEGKVKVEVECGQRKIRSFVTLGGNVYRGKMFVDATYEGDLLAAAGCSYAVGREANSVYGETVNGIAPNARGSDNHNLFGGIDPYVIKGNPASGLLKGVEPYDPNEKEGDGDSRVQAYCFRMCLTDDPKNRIPFKKPIGYSESDYELLFRNYEAQTAEEAAEEWGRGGMPWINSRMPNRKTDTNNRTGFSTDFIGRNHAWPEASYAEREKMLKEHLVYQQGLMWTLANHPRVPEVVRKEVSRWGTCRDEFPDGFGDGWQRQLYVREGRRLVGEYVMTEHNCRGDRTVPHPIAFGAYGMDSHHVRRVITKEGFVRNEGNVEDYMKSDGKTRFPPYPIDYGAIVPKRGECANILVPVCISASHIAFGSIRMEPVFFTLGQVAGAAAAYAVEDGLPVQDVPYAKLRSRLVADGLPLAPQP